VCERKDVATEKRCRKLRGNNHVIDNESVCVVTHVSSAQRPHVCMHMHSNGKASVWLLPLLVTKKKGQKKKKKLAMGVQTTTKNRQKSDIGQ
jgi:hypothetical protein